LMQQNRIHLNTSGSKRTLIHRSSLMHGKKRRFKEARQKILKDNIASTSIAQKTQDPLMYEMTPSMDHTSKGQPSEKVR
jgi:hypothetical protein